MSTTITRRNFLRATGILGAAAGIGATLAACAPDNTGTSGSTSTAAGTGTANEEGTITAAISYELGTNGYDPMTTTSALTVAANWHTLEGLTEIDPATGEVYAALASALPSADATSLDIKLRDGATFHNGDAVTADDVVFSLSESSTQPTTPFTHPSSHSSSQSPRRMTPPSPSTSTTQPASSANASQ